MNKQVVGVLLAGGASRRFGSAKAFALYNGKPFYLYSLTALKSMTDQQLIVSHPCLTAQFRHVQTEYVIEDLFPYQGCGPLAGLFTAMTLIDADWYMTAPCDTPNLSTAVYKKLWSFTLQEQEHTDAVIPVVQGKRQPLIAVYHRRCKTAIQSLLDAETFKVGALFPNIATRFIEDSSFDQQAHCFFNINHEADQELLNKLDN